MKYLLFILITTNTCFCQSLETIKTFHDPFTRSHIHEVYTVLKNTPTITGMYKRYDENGTLIEEKQFRNNTLNGITKIYFNAFMAQLWDNPKDWYGKIAEIKNYKEGELDGEYKSYQYHTGEKKIEKEIIYKNDMPIKIIEYYEKGSIKYVNQLNGENKEYYENGKLLSTSYKINGKFDGVSKIFYDNDTLKLIGYYKLNNKIGKWQEFYKNGSKICESNYNNESLNIHKIDYYENRAIKLIRDYIGDFTFLETIYDSITKNKIEVKKLKGDDDFNNLVKIGIDSIFYSNGNVKSIYNYTSTNGSLEIDSSFIEYYESGQIKKKGKYSYNKYTDTLVSYFENGKIESLIVYSFPTNMEPADGKRNGVYLLNYENGNPKIVGQYKNHQISGEWFYYKENGELDYLEYGEEYSRKKKNRIQIDDENNYRLIDSINNKINIIRYMFFQLCKVDTILIENSERPMGPKIESYIAHEKKVFFNSYVEVNNYFIDQYKLLNKSSEKLIFKEKIYICLKKLSKYLEMEDNNFLKELKKNENVEDKIKLIDNVKI